MGTSAAPIFITAKALSIHSGRLSIHSATLSPGWTPSPMSPRAMLSTAAATSAKVHRRSRKHSASRAPHRRAARSGSAPIVTFSNHSLEAAAPKPLAWFLHGRALDREQLLDVDRRQHVFLDRAPVGLGRDRGAETVGQVLV